MVHDTARDRQPPAPLGIHARAIAWGGATIALTITLAVAAVYLMIHAHAGGPFTGPNVEHDVPVATQLRSAPELERNRYFKEEQQRLQEFAWVDRGAGIARIPIETAMDLIARGIVNPSVPAESQWLPTGSVSAAASATIAAARSHVPKPNANERATEEAAGKGPSPASPASLQPAPGAPRSSFPEAPR